MVHWMRKHKKWIITGFSIIVIPTFVVWGGYGGKSRRPDRMGSDPTNVVAKVGGLPITAPELMQALNRQAQQRASRGGERPTSKQMYADGTAERVLNELIEQRLLAIEVSKRNTTFDQAFLTEQLKKDPTFQDEKGNFDAQLWNQWVDERSTNWAAIYEGTQDALARTMLLREVTAPVRINDAEIKKQFEASRTSMQVKFALVDIKVDPTDAQIQAHYDKDPSRYQSPEKRSVQFVSLPLTAPRPAAADELVTRARGGEDFAELAKQNSKGASAKDGGTFDWRDQSLDTPAAMAPLFATPVGGVTDPIEMNGAYFIFKIEEERTNESGLRGVKGREIVLKPELSEAERKAVEDKAAAVSAKAKEAGLEAAATEAGLTVTSVPEFSAESRAVENMPATDAYAVRQVVDKLEKDAVSDPIKAQQNFYVVTVLEVTPPAIQPLDAVRERVRQATIQELRMQPDHAEAVKAKAKEIQANAKSLSDINLLYPDLGAEIKETKEFTEKDYLFQEGIFVQAKSIIDAAEGKEPGAFFGPLNGFQGEAYFFEVVKRTGPTEENWKTDWPKEEVQLRKQAISRYRNSLLIDYIANLREQADKANLVQRDNALLTKLLDPKEEPGDDKAEEAPAALPVSAAPPAKEPDSGPPASK